MDSSEVPVAEGEITVSEMKELQEKAAPNERITYVKAYRKFLREYYDTNPGMPAYWVRQALGKLHPRDVIKVTLTEIIPLGRRIPRGVQ